MTILHESENFIIQVPDSIFVDRLEGGHLRIMSKLPVSDRTKLTREQAIEYTKLSMIAGEALTVGLRKRGIDIGIVNYQEMGNWMVFKPGGPVMHMHIFGRAKTATIQKYGEAVQLPFRETGFYDDFKSLDAEDQACVVAVIQELLAADKYRNF